MFFSRHPTRHSCTSQPRLSIRREFDCAKNLERNEHDDISIGLAALAHQSASPSRSPMESQYEGSDIFKPLLKPMVRQAGNGWMSPLEVTLRTVMSHGRVNSQLQGSCKQSNCGQVDARFRVPMPGFPFGNGKSSSLSQGHIPFGIDSLTPSASR